MWFMNKIVNPVVRIILRSPMHGLLSGSVLLITCTGRKSGKAYTLPVQYARDNHAIYIVPGNAEEKTWWRNLRQCPDVRLWLKGENITGEAEVLENAEQTTMIIHGLSVFFHRFPTSSKNHNVRTDSNGQLNQGDIEREARSMVVVRVKLEPYTPSKGYEPR